MSFLIESGVSGFLQSHSVAAVVAAVMKGGGVVESHSLLHSGGASGPSHSGQGQGLCSMSSPSQGVGQSHFRTRTW